MLRAIRSWAVVGHTHVMRWRGGRSVGCAYARVVLGSTPAETHTGIPNRIALHLVDGHLGSVTMNKLNEAAALARRNLNIGDFAKALEERAKLVFCNVARQSSHKDGSVVWVGKLIHLRGRVEGVVGEALHTRAGSTTPHLLGRHSTTTTATAAAAHHRTLWAVSKTMVVTAAVKVCQ